MKNNPNSDIEKVLKEFDNREFFVKHFYGNTPKSAFDWFLSDKKCAEDIMYDIQKFIEKSLLSIRESTLREVLELESMQEEKNEPNINRYIEAMNRIRMERNQLRNQIREELGKKDVHKIGEHGAVGFVTKEGRICAECNEKI